MKKITTVIVSLGLLLATFAGCGAKDAEDTVIKVGASSTPHAQILEQVKPVLEEEGYTLEIVEFSDYVLPNTALEDGELDANYFQHKLYMEQFNEENGTHLAVAAEVHYEPFGIYAGKTASIDQLKEGAQIAVPNDTTNEARALLLLEAQGLIELNPEAGIKATVKDITKNEKNLEIVEIEAAQLARTLQDVDMAVINGNYAIQADLDVNDALAIEDKTSVAATTYVNVLAVKEGNEENEKIQALVNALQTEEVKTYIQQTFGNSVVAVF